MARGNSSSMFAHIVEAVRICKAQRRVHLMGANHVSMERGPSARWLGAELGHPQLGCLFDPTLLAVTDSVQVGSLPKVEALVRQVEGECFHGQRDPQSQRSHYVVPANATTCQGSTALAERGDVTGGRRCPKPGGRRCGGAMLKVASKQRRGMFDCLTGWLRVGLSLEVCHGREVSRMP